MLVSRGRWVNDLVNLGYISQKNKMSNVKKTFWIKRFIIIV